MASFMTLKVRVGPMVYVELTGENCEEIIDALEGYADLNKKLEAMFGDLAERVYPEMEDLD
jgi:hypothetical protein